MYLTDIVAVLDFGEVSVRYYLLDILSYFKKMRTKDSFLASQNLDFAFGIDLSLLVRVLIFFC